MKFKDVIKLWTLTTILTAIEQTKAVSSKIFDKYFKANAKPVMGNTATLKIRKGAGVVLETILPGAERLVKDLRDVYEITIKLPRFGLQDTILPYEINEFETLEGEAKAEAVSKKIATILKEHKDDYMTTLEFMCVGALFGKVVDGSGKVLFEFRSTATPIEFKNKEIDIALNEIDNALVEELGTEVPYEILCSNEFYNKVVAKAKTAGDFENKTASYIDEDGTRILVSHGKRFVPYRTSYTDENGNTKKFLKANEAIVIPKSEKVYEVVYGRADHTEAVKVAPKMFFAATPQELERGKGYAIDTEMKAMPYCTRPGALINLVFSN